MIYNAVQMLTLQRSIGTFFYEIAFITKIGLCRFSYNIVPILHWIVEDYACH